jgi:hypothetical protein
MSCLQIYHAENGIGDGSAEEHLKNPKKTGS